MNDPKAAETPVRARLSKLSAEDADALAAHLGSLVTDWLRIRYALTKWGAPPILIYEDMILIYEDIRIPVDTRIA